MFIQSCLIRKNTKELVDKIEKLGYDYAENGAGAWFIPLCELNYLAVNLYSKGYYMGVNGKWDDSCYDCGTNEDLFLAMAALRDDTDKNQWFVYDNTDYADEQEKEITYFICKQDSIKDEMCINSMYADCHKATVQELIEHFKDK